MAVVVAGGIGLTLMPGKHSLGDASNGPFGGMVFAVKDLIDDCDLFVVIWSTNACNSKWVLKESRYALERYNLQGSPDFRPIPVEGPPIPPVPRGLRAYHFNDELLLSLMRATVSQPHL